MSEYMFKVGDLVRTKTKVEILSMCDPATITQKGVHFTQGMMDDCGKVFEVKKRLTILSKFVPKGYKIDHKEKTITKKDWNENWTWLEEWLEPVYSDFFVESDFTL